LGCVLKVMDRSGKQMRTTSTLIGFVFLLCSVRSFSQCTSTVSVFPYQEGFEAAAAWTSGGSASDWAWGTPAHPTIDAAATGIRAWCVGGLTGSFYALGQQSFLEGPCFNFAGTDHPYISFNIFWETERTYDGMALQYSLNAGTTWTNVGEFNGVEDCLNTNWYNAGNINNLNLASPEHGWSGRIGPTVGSCDGGQGSAGWVTAAQCLPQLAGSPSVKFRFVFGAGTQCNNYDGIAIDDIFVGEAPANAASFTYSCDGNTVSFTSTAALCPNGFAWDFGDPASGAANNSTLANPSHTFPGPGTYPVSFTVSGPCNAPSTVVIPISVLGVEFITVDPACGATNGSITALVSGTSAPLDIIWTPGGQNSAVLNNIPGGNYQVDITAANACALSETVQLGSSASPIVVNVVGEDALCHGAASGSATVDVSGGTGPFTYAWSPSGGNAATANGLLANTYTCTVTDAALCTGSATVTIDEPLPVTVAAPSDLEACPGDPIVVDPVADGGTPGYTYAWSPADPSTAPASTTTFTVVATDANGCSSLADDLLVTVGEGVLPSFTWTDSVGCAPHCVTFTDVTLGDGDRVWDLGDGTVADGNTVDHCYVAPGSYTVRLTIQAGSECDGSLEIPDLVQALPAPSATISASPTVATLDAPSFLFTGPTGSDLQLTWSFGDPTDSSATGYQVPFAYSDVGCYTVGLEVLTPEGCFNSSTVEVCVEDEFAAYIPNAFTPNGDSYNDLFGVVTTVGQPREFEFAVHDRWGRVLFQSDDRNIQWDGRVDGAEVPPGVYIWRLRMIDTKGQDQERMGHVTLLR
jgi:gliding motility-associated-like protein